MKPLTIALLLIFASTQVACSQESNEGAEPAIPYSIDQTAQTGRPKYMDNPQYIESYTLTTNDKKQFIDTIQTTLKLMAQQITLEAATQVLGEGEFMIPKASNVLRLYSFSNRYSKQMQGYPIFGVSGELHRKDDKSPFDEAYLDASTKAEFTWANFTEADFKSLNLIFVKRLVFKDLTTEELKKHQGSNVEEQSREEMIDALEYAEYHYELKSYGQTFRFVFFVKENQFNPKETKYPKNFRNIVITNESEKALGANARDLMNSKVGEPCPQTGFWTSDKLGGAEGIYMRKGDPMPGQSFNEAERATMVWRLVKPVSDA